MSITTLRIRNITDLLAGAQESFGLQVRGHPWFRGHTDASWSLLPSVHRSFSSTDEIRFTNQFRIWAPMRYSKCPEPDDLANWLCLMQHFGLPTRLLDWTASPLVAAYFAVAFEPKHCPCSIWCLSFIDLNEHMENHPSMMILGHHASNSLLYQAFRGGPAEEKVLGVVSQDVDLRMMVQQGRFTIHGTPTPLERFPDAHTFLCELTIPRISTGFHKRA